MKLTKLIFVLVQRNIKKLFIPLLLVLVILLPKLSYADPLDYWHSRNPSPTGNNLYGVTYGNGTFVAVGDLGTILTSPDGMAWDPEFSGTSAAVEWVTYASSTFVAVGENGTILTSPDGVAWTPRDSGTFKIGRASCRERVST